MKTYYYTDELNDDFAKSKNKITPKTIDKDYKYIHDNALYKTGSFVLYRLIATPVAFLYNKLFRGCTVKNRKALRKIKGGFFLYGNHTHGVGDVFTPSLVVFPRANKVIANANGVSMPIIGKVTPMLGAMPLPSTIAATRNFLEAMKTSINNGQVISIYPEAHIWPYYNKIRPFTDSSFAYPMKLNTPVVAICTTYRKRKIFKRLPPLATVTVSDPFYPKDFADKTELRNKVYEFMTAVVEKEQSVEYIKYIKRSQPMKIAIVCDVLGQENNGTTIAAMNLIRYLQEQKHEVRILCCDQDKKDQPGYYVSPTMNFFIFNKYVKKNGVDIARPEDDVIRQALDGVDIVHIMLPFALGIRACKIAKEMGIPISAGCHQLAENLSTHVYMQNVKIVNRLAYIVF